MKKVFSFCLFALLQQCIFAHQGCCEQVFSRAIDPAAMPVLVKAALKMSEPHMVRFREYALENILSDLFLFAPYVDSHGMKEVFSVALGAWFSNDNSSQMMAVALFGVLYAFHRISSEVLTQLGFYEDYRNTVEILIRDMVVCKSGNEFLEKCSGQISHLFDIIRNLFLLSGEEIMRMYEEKITSGHLFFIEGVLMALHKVNYFKQLSLSDSFKGDSECINICVEKFKQHGSVLKAIVYDWIDDCDALFHSRECRCKKLYTI